MTDLVLRAQDENETTNDFVVDAFDTVVIALTGFLGLFALLAVV